ncbi:hypothetical protein SISSUDRAFT_1066481 [Sistotremastrum suecicum HHB10207 ss-3]|uniref:NYN domain-containing protein n=1 Tax=Sistotremastrum suecicum HHB10207 ss-3 TaxID=1314776 RepID=A0A165Y9S8_9AGAM|nr:hypothetical protein SISSUDRAFT_1066481 [Sistotremastrum suecicum HHB10207 ss-3]
MGSAAAIFWDLENCRPASGANGFDVVARLRDATEAFGPISVLKAYSELSVTPRVTMLRSELQSSGVTLVDCPHNGGKEVADNMLIVDMLIHALENPTCTIILISGDRDFVYPISVLRLRRHKVVVVVPSNAHESLLNQASRVILWDSIISRHFHSTYASERQFERQDIQRIKNIETTSYSNARPPDSLESWRSNKPSAATLVKPMASRSQEPKHIRRMSAPSIQGNSAVVNAFPCPPTSSSAALAASADNEAVFEQQPIIETDPGFLPVLDKPSEVRSTQEEDFADTSLSGRTLPASSSEDAETASEGRSVTPDCFNVSTEHSGPWGDSLGDAIPSTVEPPTSAVGRDQSPEPEASPPPDLSAFEPLVAVLRLCQIDGLRQPLRSFVASALLASNKFFYEQHGVSGFTQYAEKAAKAGLVKIGDVPKCPGREWIELLPLALKAPREFQPLVDILNILIASNNGNPERSTVNILLLKNDPEIYTKHGFRDWRRYASKAAEKGIITLGHTNKQDTVMLCPPWRK